MDLEDEISEQTTQKSDYFQSEIEGGEENTRLLRKYPDKEHISIDVEDVMELTEEQQVKLNTALNNSRLRQQFKRKIHEVANKKMELTEEEIVQTIALSTRKVLDTLTRRINLNNTHHEMDAVNLDDEDNEFIKEQTKRMSVIIELLAESKSYDNSHRHRPTVIESIPEKLRNLNKDAYSPRLISIGPIHKNQPELTRKGDISIYDYLRNRKPTSIVKDILSISVKHIKSNQHCYSYNTVTKFNKQEFLGMCLNDSIFMLELFIDNYKSNGSQMIPDPWMRHDLLHDMILLENQIPCDLLMELYVHRHVLDDVPLYKLLHGYFMNVGNLANLEPLDYPYVHLLDLLRKYHCPTDRAGSDRALEIPEPVLPTYDKVQGLVLPKQPANIEKCTHNAKELQMAGIMFQKETMATKQLLDIQFNTEDGIMTIPQIIINELSETFYLNLIAFEYLNPRETKYISSYFIFMESLAKNKEDVDLLIEHEIIKNSLGNSEQIRRFFVNLRQSIALDGKEFYFSGLCHDVNTYSKDYWHRLRGSWYKWKKMLRRDYFNSPWSTISVIAAFILLSLTIIQTACSVISIK